MAYDYQVLTLVVSLVDRVLCSTGGLSMRLELDISTNHGLSISKLKTLAITYLDELEGLPPFSHGRNRAVMPAPIHLSLCFLHLKAFSTGASFPAALPVGCKQSVATKIKGRAIMVFKSTVYHMETVTSQ